MGYNLQFVSVFIVINLISMVSIAKIKFSRRFDLIKTGIHIAIFSLVLVVTIYSLEKCLIEVDNFLMINDSLLVLMNGLFSGVIVLGLFMFFYLISHSKWGIIFCIFIYMK